MERLQKNRNKLFTFLAFNEEFPGTTTTPSTL